MLRKLSLLGAIIFGVVCLWWPSSSKKSEKVVQVGVIQVIEHPALDQTRSGILKTLSKELGQNVRFKYESVQGNPGLATQVVQQMVGQKVDVIVTLGTMPSQIAVQGTKDSQIPVFFASVTDPLEARLVKNLKKPEGNVTGVSNYVDTQRQFAFFQKLFPRLKSIGMVYNPGEPNSTKLLREAQKAAQKMGWILRTAPASKSSDVGTATESLGGKVGAFFVNNDNTALAAFKTVCQVALKYKVPAFVSDVDCMDLGATAALGANQYKLGAQVARQILKYLKGSKIESIPVEGPKEIEEKVAKERLKKMA